jgi:hypothetical protein
MPVVYRSVRMVVQNSSPALLTVDAAEVVLGEWAAPNKLAVIAPQSAAVFSTRSTTLHIGSQAFVRLSSVYGIVDLNWHLPWVGSFSLTPTVGLNWDVEIDIDDSEPCAIAALAVLAPLRGVA